MNKPLTKKERESLVQDFAAERRFLDGATNAEAMIEMLLSAEAFWRETVKNAEPWQGCNVYGQTPDFRCMFCEAIVHERKDRNEHHRESCAWKLAQDE